ncbi:glutamate racemase, partial [Streptomyces sp. SID10692]|nr:glutamate racemase [Streptomyces sp. SID10692]
PPLALHASAGAVAAQALRRIGADPAPTAEPSGTLTVLRAGSVAALPDAALTYAEGRVLAAGTPVR